MILLALAAALASGNTATETPAPPPPAAVPTTGSTGETVFNGAQVREMGGRPPSLLSAPKEPDVDALYRQGIQGEIVMSGYVGGDGRMHDLVVVRSSRSPELDAVAQGLANGSTFNPGTDASGKPIAVKVNYPVSLWQDTLTNPAFLKKTCGKFLTDADWHARTFPEEQPEKYRGWLLANGMAFVSGRQSGSQAARPDYAAVYETCKAHPERKFFDVLTQR